MEMKHMKLPFSLDLQFFADGDGGDQQGDQEPDNNPGDQDNPGGTGEPDNQPEEKTFTQEDVNNIVAKEAKKAQEKLLKKLGIDDFDNAKEGLKKFKEWQDSQKTEQEKQQELLDNLSKEKESLSSENANLKAQLSALKQGVNADSVEDVVALAERLVNDETTIDDAIKQVVEKYPHFADSAEEKQQDKPTFSTGQHQKKGNLDAFAKTLLGK
mgnify:CR=1 FL=1